MAPLTWTVSAGALPAGLTLDPTTGTVSGTPTASGNFRFTLTVTDSTTSTHLTDLQALTLHIAIAPALQITTTALANGMINTPYSATVAATGGVAPLTFAVTTGSLPTGLSLAAATGVISGTPTASGDSAVTITVSDSSSGTHVTYAQALTLHIA